MFYFYTDISALIVFAFNFYSVLPFPPDLEYQDMSAGFDLQSPAAKRFADRPADSERLLVLIWS